MLTCSTEEHPWKLLLSVSSAISIWFDDVFIGAREFHHVQETLFPPIPSDIIFFAKHGGLVFDLKMKAPCFEKQLCQIIPEKDIFVPIFGNKLCHYAFLWSASLGMSISFYLITRLVSYRIAGVCRIHRGKLPAASILPVKKGVLSAKSYSQLWFHPYIHLHQTK